MRDRWACAKLHDAAVTSKVSPTIDLRNMRNLSFQDILYHRRGALWRSAASSQLIAHIGEAGLHCGAGILIGEQPPGFAREVFPRHLALHQLRHYGAARNQ